MHINRRGAARGRHLHHGLDVLLVTVHAAVGEQAEHMQRAAVGHGQVHGFRELRIARELAVGNGLGDARQVLVDDAAGAEIGVPDFGIAHLPHGQADVHARARDQRVRALGPQALEVRRAGVGDGVVAGLFGMAPAVEDDEDAGSAGNRHGNTAVGAETGGDCSNPAPAGQPPAVAAVLS